VFVFDHPATNEVWSLLVVAESSFVLDKGVQKSDGALTPGVTNLHGVKDAEGIGPAAHTEPHLKVESAALDWSPPQANRYGGLVVGGRGVLVDGRRVVGVQRIVVAGIVGVSRNVVGPSWGGAENAHCCQECSG
jgi:hypothetical protein